MRSRLSLALRSVILLALAALALAAGSAKATSGEQTRTVLYHQDRVLPAAAPYQGWLASFRVPQPPGYVDFSVGRCHGPHSDGWAGCMYWTRDDATVIMVRRDLPATEGLFAHEMGHVFDMYVLYPTGYEPRFAALFHQRWRMPHSQELFADSYAACATTRATDGVVTPSYGFHLSKVQFSRSCALIRSAYAAWLRLPAHPFGQVPPR